MLSLLCPFYLMRNTLLFDSKLIIRFRFLFNGGIIEIPQYPVNSRLNTYFRKSSPGLNSPPCSSQAFAKLRTLSISSFFRLTSCFHPNVIAPSALFLSTSSFHAFAASLALAKQLVLSLKIRPEVRLVLVPDKVPFSARFSF